MIWAGCGEWLVDVRCCAPASVATQEQPYAVMSLLILVRQDSRMPASGDKAGRALVT